MKTPHNKMIRAYALAAIWKTSPQNIYRWAELSEDPLPSTMRTRLGITRRYFNLKKADAWMKRRERKKT